MTTDDQRAYVQRWIETGRILKALRWQELRRLDDAVALAATDALSDTALRVPLPHHRQVWSGLVEQQALFHRPLRPLLVLKDDPDAELTLQNLLNEHRP